MRQLRQHVLEPTPFSCCRSDGAELAVVWGAGPNMTAIDALGFEPGFPDFFNISAYDSNLTHANDSFCANEGPPTVYRVAMVRFTMVSVRSFPFSIFSLFDFSPN